MEKKNETPRVCEKCGSTHVELVATLTFRGTLIKAMDIMAKRRGESVQELVYHLLWLEAGKIPGLRALMERESTHEH